MSRERYLQLSKIQTSQLSDPKALALHEIHDYLRFSLRSFLPDGRTEQLLIKDLFDMACSKQQETTTNAEIGWYSLTTQQAFKDMKRHYPQSMEDYLEGLHMVIEIAEMALAELEVMQDVSAEVNMASEKLRSLRQMCTHNLEMSARLTELWARDSIS